jgi:two-component system LytT family sensor kinase
LKHGAGRYRDSPPLFVNAICHSIGVVVFGLLCLLFAVDYQRTRANHHLLPAIASGLAFLWNLGSVIVLARGATPGAETDLLTALSSLRSHHSSGRALAHRTRANSTLRGDCRLRLNLHQVLLHCLEAWTGHESYHHIAILFMTAGFAALTMVSIGLQIRTGSQARGSARRLATSMCLFLIAMSFAHFGSGTASHAWAREIAFHHAGIPLALYVLLQDHRFLMLDAFVRMLSSVGPAALAVYTAIFVEHTTHFLTAVSGRPVWQGLLILAACVALASFAGLRKAVQGLLTRVVFGRRNQDSAVEDLRRLRADSASEDMYIASAAARVAQFMEADRCETVASVRPEWAAATEPFAPSDVEMW